MYVHFKGVRGGFQASDQTPFRNTIYMRALIFANDFLEGHKWLISPSCRICSTSNIEVDHADHADVQHIATS